MKEKKIRICHIVSRVNGRADGVFKHLIAQFSLLDKNQFSQILICPYSKEIEETIIKLGIKAFFINELDTKNYLKALIEIKKVFKEHDFDVISCHTLKPLIFGGYLNLFNKKKIFFFTHGIFLNNDYNTQFEKIVYKILLRLLFALKEIKILCPSYWNKSRLENELGKRIKTEIYYDGEAVLTNVNSERSHFHVENFLKKVDSKFKIIFAGRLAREKDPLLAIKIFQELKSEEISLHFFGEGELEKKLIEYVNVQKLKNIYFHGYIENVSNLFKMFDLLLLTSKREGMPIVLWEALNAGLPFLSKNVGGAAEILKYGHCGFVFEKNSEAIEIIQSLINNPDLLNNIKKVGPIIIKKYFDKQNFINFFSNLYQKLV